MENTNPVQEETQTAQDPLELDWVKRVSNWWTPYRLANAVFLFLFLGADVSLFIFGKEATNNLFLALVITLLSGFGALLWKRQRDNEKSNETQRSIALWMIVVHGIAAVVFTVGHFGRGGWEVLANNIRIDGQMASEVINYIVIIEKVFMWSIGIMLALDLLMLFIFMEQDTEKSSARKLAKIARETENMKIQALEQKAKAVNSELTNKIPVLAKIEGLVESKQSLIDSYTGKVPTEVLNNMLSEIDNKIMELGGAIPVGNSANSTKEDAPFQKPSPQALAEK